MASQVPIVDYLVLDGPGAGGVPQMPGAGGVPQMPGAGGVPQMPGVGGVPQMTAHLEANECAACGARYFDRRNGCANPDCSDAGGFRRVALPTTGEVKAFTIVSHAAPGIPVPFVAALVDCEGTSVRGNLINVEPDPDHVSLGMKVRLATFPLGADREGTEAIGFGFEPISS